jgi:hypothetical protein
MAEQQGKKNKSTLEAGLVERVKSIVGGFGEIGIKINPSPFPAIAGREGQVKQLSLCFCDVHSLSDGSENNSSPLFPVDATHPECVPMRRMGVRRKSVTFLFFALPHFYSDPITLPFPKIILSPFPVPFSFSLLIKT